MPRIRSIKPEFWTSEQVLECSPLTRLMFIGMWNFADDCGRLPFSPKSIKAQVFPSDDISLDTIRGMIQELSANGLVLIYAHSGNEYLEITGWSHQRIDKPQKSKYPGPFHDHSTNVPRTFPPDRKGEDRKGKEGNGADANVSADLYSADSSERRLGDFCQAIVTAYAEANSPVLPDTSRASLWLAQGFEPEICLPVLRDILKRRPTVPLVYFDKPIAEAHGQKAPKRLPIGPDPPPDWDAIVNSYVRFKRWPKGMGNDPESPSCRAPPDVLRKYGIEPLSA